MPSVCVSSKYYLITTEYVLVHDTQYKEHGMSGYQITRVSIYKGVCACAHRHLKSGPPFFLIWSLPRLWYRSLSGSIYLNHLSICYNISCYNSLVLITLVFRSSCRITYIYIQKGMKQSSKYKERGNPCFDSIFYNNAPVFKRSPFQVKYSNA